MTQHPVRHSEWVCRWLTCWDSVSGGTVPPVPATNCSDHQSLQDTIHEVVNRTHSMCELLTHYQWFLPGRFHHEASGNCSGTEQTLAVTGPDFVTDRDTQMGDKSVNYELDMLSLDEECDWGPPADPPVPDNDGADVLQALLHRLIWFASLNEPVAAQSRQPEIAGLRRHGIPYAPCEWFGPVNDKQRQRYSRATMRLEGDGYVIRITELRRDRVTHLRPTLNGLMWALRASPATDIGEVTTALRRTEWGRRLAEDVEIAGVDP
jgi:hypothetical protein